MEQLRADHVKQDRLVRLVLWLTAASLLLTGLIIYLGLPRIFSTSNDSLAIRRNSEIQGCRAAYQAQVTSAMSDANQLILEGLAAAASDDDASLSELVTPDASGRVSGQGDP